MLGFCSVARLLKRFYNCMLKSNQISTWKRKAQKNPTPDQGDTGNRWKREIQFSLRESVLSSSISSEHTHIRTHACTHAYQEYLGRTK